MTLRTIAILGLTTGLLLGCGGRVPEPAPPLDEPVAQAAPPDLAIRQGERRAEDRFWVPRHFHSVQDEAHYHVSRLADRSFVDVYGGDEHPRVWYIAAERLGQIGEPAVPLLFGLIDSGDDYELMLVLYALQLATQDPALMAQTAGDYVRLTSVLDPQANAQNREIALAWWERHGWRWQ